MKMEGFQKLWLVLGSYTATSKSWNKWTISQAGEECQKLYTKFCWAPWKSFPWRPTWRHLTSTDCQSHPKLTRSRQDFQVWAPSWFSSVGACTQMNTQHTVTKLLGQPQQRDCKDLHLSPCSRGSTAPVLPWPCGEGRFLHNPPSPAAHTPLPGVCHRKNEQH